MANIFLLLFQYNSKLVKKFTGAIKSSQSRQKKEKRKKKQNLDCKWKDLKRKKTKCHKITRHSEEYRWTAIPHEQNPGNTY